MKAELGWSSTISQALQIVDGMREMYVESERTPVKMSDTGLGQDCLVHYNNQHIQVRRDFFDLCAYDKKQFNQKRNEKGNIIKDEPNQECMAKILRLFETLTDRKREEWYLQAQEAKSTGLALPPLPQSFPIPLAYSTICTLLYNTCGESTVRNSIAHLIHLGYIERSQESKASIPMYILNIPVLQEALQKQAQDQLEKRLLKSTPTPKRRKQGVEIEDQGVEINSQTPEFNTLVPEFNTNNITNKITDKNQMREKSDHPQNRPSTTGSPPPDKPQSQQATIPEEAVIIMDYWDEIEGEPVPRTDKHIKAAMTLAACHPTKEEMQKRKAHGLADNPDWYRKHGLDLTSLANNWSKWKPHSPKSPAKTGSAALPGYRSLKDMIPADFQVKKTPSEVK